jgi:hypothetical protein
MNRVLSTFLMKPSALAAALLLVAAALLALAPLPVQAAVLYTTGFESDAASSVVDPDPSGDFDPAGWLVNEVNASDIQVSSYVGAGGPPSVAGGSQYLRLSRVNGGYNVFLPVGNGSAPFYVKFDAYLPPSPTCCGDLYVRINGGNEQVAVGVVGAANQFNYLLNGSTWQALPGFATFNTWKSVAIQVNSFHDGVVTPGTYDLYYDNALVAAGLPYNGTSGGTFNFAFGLANGDKYYVDNVELGSGQLVPEPTSACLLGAGVVGLLACTRRKRR